MTIVVRLVLGFAADVDKDNNDDIRHKVAQRVNGICHHRGTMSHDASDELEKQQNHVDDAAHQCHFVYLFVSFHFARKDTYFL